MAFQANDRYSANLSAGYTAGQGTMSVTAVPQNVPTIITVAKGTDKEAVFAVNAKTASDLTGVVRLRGYSGNYDANTAIVCLNNEEFVNQFNNILSIKDWTNHSYSSNITLNLDASVAEGGKKHYIDLAGDANLILENVSPGDIFTVAVRQSSGGNHKITWFDGAVWADGVAPELTPADGAVDVFVFVQLLGGYYGYVVGQNS